MYKFSNAQANVMSSEAQHQRPSDSHDEYLHYLFQDSQITSVNTTSSASLLNTSKS